MLQLHANYTFTCILVLSSIFFYLLNYMVEKHFRMLLETKIHDLLIMLKMYQRFCYIIHFFFRRIGPCSARLTYLLLACNRDCSNLKCYKVWNKPPAHPPTFLMGVFQWLSFTKLSILDTKRFEKCWGCDKVYVYNRKSVWERGEFVQANLKGSKGSCYVG